MHFMLRAGQRGRRRIVWHRTPHATHGALRPSRFTPRIRGSVPHYTQYDVAPASHLAPCTRFSHLHLHSAVHALHPTIDYRREETTRRVAQSKPYSPDILGHR
jgi:hypothetical protein